MKFFRDPNFLFLVTNIFLYLITFSHFGSPPHPPLAGETSLTKLVPEYINRYIENTIGIEELSCSNTLIPDIL